MMYRKIVKFHLLLYQNLRRFYIHPKVFWNHKYKLFNIAEAQSTPVEDPVGDIPSNLVTNRASNQQKLSATLGRILKIPKSILSGEFYIEIFLYMNFQLPYLKLALKSSNQIPALVGHGLIYLCPPQLYSAVVHLTLTIKLKIMSFFMCFGSQIDPN